MLCSFAMVPSKLFVSIFAFHICRSRGRKQGRHISGRCASKDIGGADVSALEVESQEGPISELIADEWVTGAEASALEVDSRIQEGNISARSAKTGMPQLLLGAALGCIIGAGQTVYNIKSDDTDPDKERLYFIRGLEQMVAKLKGLSEFYDSSVYTTLFKWEAGYKPVIQDFMELKLNIDSPASLKDDGKNTPTLLTDIKVKADLYNKYLWPEVWSLLGALDKEDWIPKEWCKERALLVVLGPALDRMESIKEMVRSIKNQEALLENGTIAHPFEHLEDLEVKKAVIDAEALFAVDKVSMDESLAATLTAAALSAPVEGGKTAGGGKKADGGAAYFSKMGLQAGKLTATQMMTALNKGSGMGEFKTSIRTGAAKQVLEAMAGWACSTAAKHALETGNELDDKETKWFETLNKAITHCPHEDEDVLVLGYHKCGTNKCSCPLHGMMRFGTSWGSPFTSDEVWYYVRSEKATGVECSAETCSIACTATAFASDRNYNAKALALDGISYKAYRTWCECLEPSLAQIEDYSREDRDRAFQSSQKDAAVDLDRQMWTKIAYDTSPATRLVPCNAPCNANVPVIKEKLSCKVNKATAQAIFRFGASGRWSKRVLKCSGCETVEVECTPVSVCPDDEGLSAEELYWCRSLQVNDDSLKACSCAPALLTAAPDAVASTASASTSNTGKKLKGW